MTDKLVDETKKDVKAEASEKPLPQPPPTPAPMPPPTRLRHDPNRAISEYNEQDENNRLHIARSDYPAGFDLQWVTSSILGRAEPQYRQRFERKGWVPILANEFEGKFAHFMPDGYTGEVEQDGLVLMARPMTFTKRAQELDRREALSRVQIKEKQIRGGEIEKVGFDTHDPSALRYNKIGKSYETISVPDDQGK